MKQLTILGSGAAPGVPSLGRGWGACDPQNPKKTGVCGRRHIWSTTGSGY